jgi:hypothetical protein
MAAYRQIQLYWRWSCYANARTQVVVIFAARQITCRGDSEQRRVAEIRVRSQMTFECSKSTKDDARVKLRRGSRLPGRFRQIFIAR